MLDFGVVGREASVSIEQVVGGGWPMVGSGQAMHLGRGQQTGPERWSYQREMGRRKEVAMSEASGGGKPIVRKITEKKKVLVAHSP
jgi:hypothetical protein